MCVIASVSPHAGRHAFGTAENTHYIYHSHTQKTHTFLVTAPFPHHTLYPPDHTKKRHTFRHGAVIVADDINYFSSPIACAINALFASLAALFASRLVLRKFMYFFVSASCFLPSLSYATKSTESSV